jgi:hypothetical protein
MARPDAVSQLATDFDAFLFAPIGEEKNGMLLSVVSALARSNVDPWQEAAGLARLPANTAARRLAAMIAALPGAQSMLPDSSATAARLVRLLPHPAQTGAAARGQLPAAAGALGATRSWWIIYALFFVLALTGQAITAGLQPPPKAADTHPAPMASAGSQVPAPGFSR